MPYSPNAPIIKNDILCSRNFSGLTKLQSDASIIIGITVKNSGKTILSALESAMKQTVFLDGIADIIILDDQSTDNWQQVVADHLEHQKIFVINAQCGSPAHSRNAVLDIVDRYCPNARWVARLDSDDEFDTPRSLEALYEAGEEKRSKFVLGSNKLRKNDHNLPINTANPNWLTDENLLLRFIEDFCSGKNENVNELPSCNLLLATHIGVRYPNIRSAEDHWVVAYLLIFYANKGTIVPFPEYAIYSLDGEDTNSNKDNNIYRIQRERLLHVVKTWHRVKGLDGTILGAGLEGVVWKSGQNVFKEFYDYAMNDDGVQELKKILPTTSSIMPSVRWFKECGLWRCCYQYEETNPFSGTKSKTEIHAFLREFYLEGIVATNVKRDNIRIGQNGTMLYVDIGKDIQRFSTSYFRDMAARTYAILHLGLDDTEYARRISFSDQVTELKKLDGFELFYKNLIEDMHHDTFQFCHQRPLKKKQATDTTLLIKCCGQDQSYLEHQVRHISSQLTSNTDFAAIEVVIDPKEGNYLRHFDDGDLRHVLACCEKLKDKGVIDSYKVAPSDPAVIRQVYKKWFNREGVTETHTLKNAPLFPQIWAFDTIRTRYILQCDVDVLVGRKSIQHHYLTDMRTALDEPDVISVGFNIPQCVEKPKPYTANSGEHVPEVRFCLLDMVKVNTVLPIENEIENGKFRNTWHRAVEAHQKKTGMRSLRGGDHRTFYIHPQNIDKKSLETFSTVRDLIAQGVYPIEQGDNWDLTLNANWQYPKRPEPIVFLLKGSNTNPKKLLRCFQSLSAQSLQNFGLIVIDDQSNFSNAEIFRTQMSFFGDRVTLIQRTGHYGHIHNIKDAVENVVENPKSIVAILDQDDALLSDKVADILFSHQKMGHDLIQMPMFRPSRPLKLYSPTYDQPRQHGGSDVWCHLRAFSKELFERIPDHYLEMNGTWIDTVTDFATMLPMSELAENPIFVDRGYVYLHERGDYTAGKKTLQNTVKAHIFSKPLCRTN